MPQMREALLLSGVVSSLVYLTAIDILAPLVHPEYHDYASQMVSELMAHGSPTRIVIFPLMALYNTLVFAFAAGVWLSRDGSRAVRLTTAALLGYGLCSSSGLFLASMEVREAGLSEQTVLHIWVTALQGIFIALSLGFGAFAVGPRFRLYSLATLTACLIFGALAGAQAAQGAMSWIGITERINIYAWMLWIAVLAIALLGSGRSRLSKGAMSGHGLKQEL